jgi:hypothetical protein
MKTAQWLQEYKGQQISGLICRSVEIEPFSTVSSGVIRAGVSLKIVGYNREGLISGLLDDYEAKDIMREIVGLLTESEEKDPVLKQIKELLKSKVEKETITV